MYYFDLKLWLGKNKGEKYLSLPAQSKQHLHINWFSGNHGYKTFTYQCFPIMPY